VPLLRLDWLPEADDDPEDRETTLLPLEADCADPLQDWVVVVVVVVHLVTYTWTFLVT
jgi:hypothetical protein